MGWENFYKVATAADSVIDKIIIFPNRCIYSKKLVKETFFSFFYVKDQVVLPGPLAFVLCVLLRLGQDAFGVELLRVAFDMRFKMSRPDSSVADCVSRPHAIHLRSLTCWLGRVSVTCFSVFPLVSDCYANCPLFLDELPRSSNCQCSTSHHRSSWCCYREPVYHKHPR